MRHRAILAGAALSVALVLALAAVSWPVDPTRVAGDLAIALESIDAPEIDRPASATLTLLPRPMLHISGFVVRALGGALAARATSGEVELRWDRLLFGQFAPVDVKLENPEIRLDL